MQLDARQSSSPDLVFDACIPVLVWSASETGGFRGAFGPLI